MHKENYDGISFLNNVLIKWRLCVSRKLVNSENRRVTIYESLTENEFYSL